MQCFVLLNKNSCFPKILTRVLEVPFYHLVVLHIKNHDLVRANPVVATRKRLFPLDTAHFSRVTGFCKTGPAVDHIHAEPFVSPRVSPERLLSVRLSKNIHKVGSMADAPLVRTGGGEGEWLGEVIRVDATRVTGQLGKLLTKEHSGAHENL